MTSIFDKETGKFKKLADKKSQLPVAQKGDKGDSGSPLQLRVEGGVIQWKLQSDEQWKTLTAVPPAGKDGKPVQLRAVGNQLLWQLAGDSEWQLLATLPAPARDGADGRNIELRNAAGYVQWRLAGDTEWKNLYRIPGAAAGGSGAALQKLQEHTAAADPHTQYLKKSSNLFDLQNIPAARNNLGLGQLAIQNTVDLSSQVEGINDIEHGGTGANNCDDAIANLFAGLTTDGVADAASPDVIYAYYNNTGKGGARFVSGADLASKIIANGGFGTLAFQSSIDLVTQVSGILSDANGGYKAYENTGTASLSQLINAGATYVWQIPLGASNYTHGHLIVRDNISLLGSSVHFTTASADSRAESNFATYIYNSYVASTNCRINSVDGRLSENSTFGGASGSGVIRLNHALINGSNLELSFTNSSGANVTLNCRTKFRVHKGSVGAI